jgi:hypothetical protein
MNKKEHFFVCLIEECLEIGKNVCKILRFGLHDQKDELHPSNKILTEEEIYDLYGVIELLEEAGLIQIKDNPIAQDAIRAKKKKVIQNLLRARENGTLFISNEEIQCLLQHLE